MSAQSLCLSLILSLPCHSFLLFSSSRKRIDRLHLVSVSTVLRQQQLKEYKMARFNALLCFVFALGLFSSASMAAPTPSPAPKAAAPKLSPTSPPPAASPIVLSPASSPKVATPTASPPSPAPITSTPPPASTPITSTPPPASTPSPSASPPPQTPPSTNIAPASPPTVSGAPSTASLEKMAIFGAALLGGAAFLL